jgi:uncharacterized protein (DUF1499 family)
MSTDRAYDVALTEAAFRVANERMARWDERHADGAEEMYLCECAAQPCRERIRLSRDEYESVRSDPRRFVVVPGHVIPELETVVQSSPGYEVIEKPSALLDLLVETDPRHEQSGRASETAETLADEIQS